MPIPLKLERKLEKVKEIKNDIRTLAWASQHIC